MPKLLLLRGPSATGKSTYRNQLVENDPTWRYTNLDNLRDLYPRYTEKEIQKLQKQSVEFMATLKYNICIDNTNLNPKTVEAWKNWAYSNNYEFEIKEFGHDISWETAVKRDNKRQASVGRSVIMQQYMQAGLFTDIPRNVIIIDLDGTLCNIDHRKHYVTIPNVKKDWKSFFSELCNDTVNNPVKLIYHSSESYADIIFVSGRGSEYRKETEKWLSNNGFNDYHMLLMRGFNDKRDDVIVKQELYEKYIAPYYTVLYAIDDRPRIVQMWRSLGIFTLAVGDLQDF